MKARHEFKTDEQWYDYLRIYFAAMVIKGMASSWNNDDQDRQEAAKRSVKLADALIIALNQTNHE